MANYAIPSSRPYSMTPFRGYAGGMEQLDRNVWDANPSDAYQWFLSHLNPSSVDDNMLRQMFSRYHTQYMSRQIADPSGTKYPDELSFLDYMAKQNPNQDLAGFGPQARNRDQRRLTQPARWVLG